MMILAVAACAVLAGCRSFAAIGELRISPHMSQGVSTELLPTDNPERGT